jgi:hypothetical protein
MVGEKGMVDDDGCGETWFAAAEIPSTKQASFHLTERNL